jgi:transcription initiation factor IIE alpha subunit
MVTHTAKRPLAGVEGYRRLARLVARLFYGGECPPKEEDAAVPEGRPPPAPGRGGSRLPKHTFEGLGVLLIDFLTTSSDAYVDELAIASALKLGQKNIRKTLRYLEGEHILSSSTVKFSLRRKNVELPDDPDIEERRRQETHVYWCIDYPRMLEGIQLRLHRMKETLRRGIEETEVLQKYLCVRCGATFSSLDALALLDPLDGSFRCEHCKAELREHVEGPQTGGAGANGTLTSRRERQAFYKDLQARLEAQLRPLHEQLERLRGTAPPDHGNLQDWWQNKKEEELRRQKRAEAARRLLAGGDGGRAEMTVEQLDEFAARAEVVVALPGQELEGAGPSGTDLGPGKELPAWFRSEEEVGVGSVSVGPGVTAGSEELQGGVGERAAAVAEQERLRQQQYLEQYLLQIRMSMGAGATGVVGAEEKAGVKAEEQPSRAEGVKEEEPLGVGASLDHEMEAVKWEDVGNMEATRTKIEGDGAGAAADDVEWEDA